MNKTGWKVVRKKADDTLESAIITGPAWRRRYVVGEPTKGRFDTPVLAFCTRQQARIFKGGDRHRIYKAQLENPRLTHIADWCHPQDFRLFWADPEAYEWRLSAPEGTLACDAITLLERA